MSYLLPVAYIQEVCLLSDNIDEKKILVALEMAQEDLEDILGPEFFTQIDTQYTADTLSADNTALYNPYIKKFLAWQSNYYYVGHANEDSTPTGFREHKEENSDLLSDVKMFAKEKKLLERANRHKYKMINFLKLSQSQDSTKYNLWEDNCKDEMSFSITAIDADGDAKAMVRVNKSINNNE